MSALLRSCLTIACLGALTAPAAAQSAAGFAPALFGVKEIIVEAPRLGSSDASRECGVLSERVADTVASQLRELGLPAQVPVNAPMPNAAVARVTLQPEIVTLHQEGLTCTSWVSLTVEGRSTLQVPPVSTPRTVTITYWKTGSLIASTEQAHDAAVRNVIIKQAAKFADDYKTDQPPPLPDLGQ